MYVNKFFNELRKTGLTNPWAVDTFVQIIVPHYAPRLDYLELTVKSALDSWGPARDILVVSSSKIDPTANMEALSGAHNVRCYHQNEKLNFSQANNKGLEMLHEKTTHILLLNDDTIMSKKALGSMVESIGDKLIILNPYSNCDKGWLHNDTLTTSTGVDLHPNMTIEELSKSEDLEAVKDMDFRNSETKPHLNPTEFCAMYCTLLPKGVLDRVGTLSTLFLSGGEDYDYSQRAARLGMPSYWTKDAFVFHFGGKTRKVAESEDHTIYHNEDRHNNLLIRKRWPKEKKRVAIWTGPAWETWHLDTHKESGLGGSETCASRLAQTMMEEGHAVTLYGAHEEQEQYGIQLVPWEKFKPNEEYFDLFIASRSLNPIIPEVRAKKCVVWIHDIFILSGQQIADYPRNRVDKFIVLSPWHKGFVKGHHTLTDNEVEIIPNGVNVELFDEFNPENKVPGKLLWTSSPDRGLDNLLYMLPWIKEKIPELHLDVTYGFHNWESMCRNRNDTAGLKSIEQLKKAIDDAKDYVTLHGRVAQPKLAEMWSKTYLWMYPTLFTETSCLSAKEAQISGTPILSSNVAALETTVGDYGHRVQHHPYSKEGREEFVSKAIEILSNKTVWTEMSAKSREGAQGISWKARYEDYWKKWVEG